MREIYKHIFKNGESITLVVDFSGPRIKISSTKLTVGTTEEYIQWRDEIVFPDIVNKMNSLQIAMLAQKGFDFALNSL